MKKLNEKDVIKYFKSCGYKVLSKYERYCNPIEIEKDGYKQKILNFIQAVQE